MDKLNAIVILIRLIVFFYGGLRFFLGDKEDEKTLWYGILALLSGV